jgi:hypothetical protein
VSIGREGAERVDHCIDISSLDKPEAATESLIEGSTGVAARSSLALVRHEIGARMKVALVEAVSVDHEPPQQRIKGTH